MPLTPEDVRNQRFKERFKGYDVDEVDAFLDRVMQTLEELHDERDTLRRERDEAAGGMQEPNELLARTLMTAQRAADETLAQAQADAAKLLEEARGVAAKVATESEERHAAERTALEAESARVSRAAESLVHFRTEYRSRVQAVIAEQLALLDRAGELPDVPPAVRDLATFGEGLAAPGGREDTAPADVPVVSALGEDDDGAELRDLARLAEQQPNDEESGALGGALDSDGPA